MALRGRTTDDGGQVGSRDELEWMHGAGFFLCRPSSPGQKSECVAIGGGTRLTWNGSILFSAQIDSAQTYLSRRQRLAMYMGSLNVSASSTLTSASRNLPSGVTLKCSTTCSLSVCGVRKSSMKLY